jgi:hypothetical protein
VIQEKIDCIAVIVLIFFGIVFFFLTWWYPKYIEQLRVQSDGGVRAEFTPGAQSSIEAVVSLITAFSILSAIAVALIVLPSSENKSTISILLSVITLIIFLTGIVWSLHLSLIRLLSGVAPKSSFIYLSLRLLLLGLSFIMFTLASRVLSRV